MDFYSGKQPNLIGPVMKSTICKIMKQKPVNNTVSDKVVLYVTNFYENYIIENIALVLIIMCIVTFLIYRYNMIQSNINKKEKFINTDKNNNLFKDITDYQTRHLRYSNQPYMNPINTPDDKTHVVNYVPDEQPINVPGVGLIDPKLLHQPKSNIPLNNVNYDYNNVYNNPSLSYYNGTYNTYQNAMDTDITNPYNWSNEFNTNTSNFVSPMTDLNNQNLIDYQNILDNMNNNLTHQH